MLNDTHYDFHIPPRIIIVKGKQIDALMRILSPRPDWYAIREEGGLFHRPHVTGSDGFTQTEPLWDRSKGPNWDSGLEWTDRISLPLSVLDGDQSTVGFKPVEHFIPQKRDDLGW
ncbi:hypothetical protein FBUS_01885 [Fasciolopsis buskii]|uniref:Uncharacterized protein n=1 Tax=Fasciolopsis buskii TaxID=27845 RepID=A0A8E0VPQ4_9TREM|nr:hypothetical protein FBUS_01885 [Fasciolopsis buski]